MNYFYINIKLYLIIKHITLFRYSHSHKRKPIMKIKRFIIFFIPSIYITTHSCPQSAFGISAHGLRIPQ